MPLYEYECPTCGVFSEMHPISQAQQPAPCPECGASSARRISAPFIAGLSTAVRNAHERNERSAHEPRLARKSSCGCTGAHTCRPRQDNPATTATRVQASTRLNQRPWMLGH